MLVYQNKRTIYSDISPGNKKRDNRIKALPIIFYSFKRNLFFS